jgi:hypothetical protein
VRHASLAGAGDLFLRVTGTRPYHKPLDGAQIDTPQKLYARASCGALPADRGRFA